MVAGSVRVFISYAQDGAEHEDRVRELWVFLRSQGIDARLDLPARERRQDWPVWMLREVRAARFVLVVASPAYKRRAEGDAAPGEGRGVQWEAALIREEVYADREAALEKFLPVVLPGCSVGDISVWLGPNTTTHYAVTACTVAGAEKLLRCLLDQPFETEPPIGTVPTLPPREVFATTPSLRTAVTIRAELQGGRLVAQTEVAGTPLGRQEGRVPTEVPAVWESLRAGPLVAAERMVAAGWALTRVLFDERSERVVAGLVERLPPGDWVDVVLHGDSVAASLPVELLRLSTAAGADLGPLCLRGGVTIRRQVSGAPLARPVTLPGPVKVLVAVAAPMETLTRNVPLDVEAEMQAVLDAVTDLAGDPSAQVQILEVASLEQIRDALSTDAYHSLHLSAHGSTEAVELEDEDGSPVPVDAETLIQALRHANRPVPLIFLSACSGDSGGAEAMAAGLIARGADRVIAMQASVTDEYATALAASFYRELARDPGQPVSQVLARARLNAAEQPTGRGGGGADAPLPEYGVATLLSAADDTPLLDPAAAPQRLSHITAVPTGTSVRELSMGQLIGRRAELRATTAVLRRTPKAVDAHGAAAGVVLVGVGGIGKTAVAGRVMTRLRGEGWAVAVHEGRWNPTALFAAVAEALDAQPAVLAAHPELRHVANELRDSQAEDLAKLPLVGRLLRTVRLLVVFDDFEQNLTAPGDEAFTDPIIAEVLTGLAEAARTGGLLVTCRYRLPGTDRTLVEVGLPALSPSELRRLFWRLPALRDLDAADRRLLTRTIGGHPRLIEFVDALLRGGRANLFHVQDKLRDLATQHGIDLTRRPNSGAALDQATEQAMQLGAADILLDDLLALLPPTQVAVFHQIAVSRAPMNLDDLGYALSADPPPDEPSSTDPAALPADVDRLSALTLLTAGPDITMHLWTAELVCRAAGRPLDAEHERALAMRLRRFEQGNGGYEDLLDIPRHLAHLGRYDDLADVAGQAAQVLSGTLATAAFLAETRPLIPPQERAWVLVADLELTTLLAAGDLRAATRLADDIHQAVADRAAADPTNTGWQRDLSLSHDRLGDLAIAVGDLTAAEGSFQAGLAIAQRLAAADPTNAQWQRDLSVIQQRLAGLAAGPTSSAPTGQPPRRRRGVFWRRD